MKTPVLLAAATFTLSALGQVPGNVPADGLVAWYPLDNSMTDAGPNGLDGTVSNASAATDRFGTDGAATLFFGYSYDLVPSNTLFNTGAGMTVTAWVQLVDANANQKIAGRVNGSFNSGFILGVENGQMHPEVWSSTGGAHAFSAGTIPSGQWTHLAITWASSGYLVAYVNGVAADSITTEAEGIGANNEPLIIGGSPWSQSPLYFGVNGSLDDIGIWNRALSADEIDAVYNATTAGIGAHGIAASVSLFPVPAGRTLSIRTAPEWAGRAYRIVDATGRAVRQGQLGNALTTVDVAGLARGIYTVVLNDGRATALRFVKE